MNYTLKHQIAHRSIRHFKDEPLAEATRQSLVDVMQQTATSHGLQSSSVLHVTTAEKKKQLAEIGQQAYIAKVPELYVFLVDTRRLYQLAQDQGFAGGYARSMDFFFRAYTDAYLMAQNLMTAVEALGLGAVFLGCIQNNPFKTIDVLELPELTFPVLGVALGEPTDRSAKKPRLPKTVRFYQDTVTPTKDLKAEVAKYDQTMQDYYENRVVNPKTSTYTGLVQKQLTNVLPMRAQVLKAVEQQGFKLLPQENERWEED